MKDPQRLLHDDPDFARLVDAIRNTGYGADLPADGRTAFEE